MPLKRSRPEIEHTASFASRSQSLSVLHLLRSGWNIYTFVATLLELGSGIYSVTDVIMKC